MLTRIIRIKNLLLVSLPMAIGMIACTDQDVASTTSTENVVQLKAKNINWDEPYEITVLDTTYLPPVISSDEAPLVREVQVDENSEITLIAQDNDYVLVEVRQAGLLAWQLVNFEGGILLSENSIELKNPSYISGGVIFNQYDDYDNLYVGLAGSPYYVELTGEEQRSNDNTLMDTLTVMFSEGIGALDIEDYKFFVYWTQRVGDENKLIRKSPLINLDSPSLGSI